MSYAPQNGIGSLAPCAKPSGPTPEAATARAESIPRVPFSSPALAVSPKEEARSIPGPRSSRPGCEGPESRGEVAAEPPAPALAPARPLSAAPARGRVRRRGEGVQEPEAKPRQRKHVLTGREVVALELFARMYHECDPCDRQELSDRFCDLGWLSARLVGTVMCVHEDLEDLAAFRAWQRRAERS